MSATLSSALKDELQMNHSDKVLDVILELRSDLPATPARGSRQERTETLKAAFARSLAPVEKAVRAVGGEIIRSAWINRTVRAQVPVEKVGELAQHENIVAIDLPRALTPEVTREP